jgi:hypothetical protein
LPCRSNSTGVPASPTPSSTQAIFEPRTSTYFLERKVIDLSYPSEVTTPRHPARCPRGVLCLCRACRTASPTLLPGNAWLSQRPHPWPIFKAGSVASSTAPAWQAAASHLFRRSRDPTSRPRHQMHPSAAGGREFGCQAEHFVPALQRRVSAIERPSSYLGMPNVSLSLA